MNLEKRTAPSKYMSKNCNLPLDSMISIACWSVVCVLHLARYWQISVESFILPLVGVRICAVSIIEVLCSLFGAGERRHWLGWRSVRAVLCWLWSSRFVPSAHAIFFVVVLACPAFADSSQCSACLCWWCLSSHLRTRYHWQLCIFCACASG